MERITTSEQAYQAKFLHKDSFAPIQIGCQKATHVPI
jgi:hypothetical protein